MRPESAAGPGEEYAARLARRRAKVDACRKGELRFSAARAAIFLAGLGLAWPALFARALSPLWLAAPVVAFVAAAVAHDRLIRRREALERAAAFYERGQARLAGQWSGTGPTGVQWFEPGHPYAADLDLAGPGSLFQLLCAARTRVGERTLAGWLARPAVAEEIRARQQAVEELRDRLELREQLAVVGGEAATRLDDERLVAWSRRPRELRGATVLVAAVLAAINVAGLLSWFAAPAGGLLFCAAILASGTYAFRMRHRVAAVLSGVDRAAEDLAVVAALAARLEAERFAAPRLVELQAALVGGGGAARRIARLGRLVELRDSRENMIFRPFAALLLFGTQVACAMERWRAASGAAVERWLAAVGEIEALASLAQLACERPGDAFPSLAAAGPRFEGTGLVHPLLPAAAAVPNDVRLDGSRQLLLVSGSNMSGKSTLLRTVGVNAVLAQAGATVCARSLTVSWLDIGACLHVQDSIQERTSHLQAEIRRLRQIVSLGGVGRGVLFLLDEILHGTNSHDRRIGAEGVIRALLARGGIGLVTTHDLALAAIAEALAPRAANVHFEDRVEGQHIVFDYRLRDGVVRRSNALDLMRAAGLEV